MEENNVEIPSEEEEDTDVPKKNANTLALWGNEKTMNLNTLLLTNIQSSHYFKVNLFEFKTYHEVVDEIYYKVNHMEPWEKGSRKTAGQTGMCGGVRGVGVGGIVSTAFSCLYKLFTLKLTRKQVNGLLNHTDSPYLRGVGFMYLRYTQPPADLWGWYEPYLEDQEMIDVKAGGGEEMMMGVMVRKMMTKLDWYGTLFPRIPVPIQMKVKKLLQERFPVVGAPPGDARDKRPSRDQSPAGRDQGPPADRNHRERTPSPSRHRGAPARDIAEEIAMEKERIRREREPTGATREARGGSRNKERGSRDRDRPGSKGRDRSRERHRSKSRERNRDRHGSRSRDHRRQQDDRPERRRRSRSPDHKESRSRDDGRADHKESRGRDDGKADHKESRARERRHRSRSHERDKKVERARRSRSRERDRKAKRSRSRERRPRSRSPQERRQRRSRSREQRR